MKRNKYDTKKLTFLSLCTAFALILSYVESLLPPLYAAVPGIKPGLANLAVLFILYKYGAREAACVSLVRVLLSALLFGNPMTFIYSFSGAFFSLAVMALLKKGDLFGKSGTSILGALSHNAAQLCIALFALKTNLLFYLPALAFSGVISGAFVGIAGSFILNKTKNIL